MIAADDLIARSAEAEPSVSPATVELALERAQREGWVRHRQGVVAGISLTTNGRTVVNEAVRSAISGPDRADLSRRYERFLELNTTLLSLCTAWQVVTVDGVDAVNDHQDLSRDAETIRGFSALHADATDLLIAMSGGLPRAGAYRERLGQALENALAGDTDWLCHPLVDSYHSVWFEWHEDLLCSLGRTRHADVTRVDLDA